MRRKRGASGRVVADDADDTDLRRSDWGRGRAGWMMADRNVRPTKTLVVGSCINGLLIDGGGVARIARFFAGGRNGIEELRRKMRKEFLDFVGGATATRNLGSWRELQGPLWQVGMSPAYHKSLGREVEDEMTRET